MEHHLVITSKEKENNITAQNTDKTTHKYEGNNLGQSHRMNRKTVEVSFKCIHLKCFFAADNDIGILDFLLNFKYLDPARTVKNLARWLVFGVWKLNFALEPLVREGLNVKKSVALNPHCPVMILWIIMRSVVFLLDSKVTNSSFLFLNAELGILQYV